MKKRILFAVVVIWLSVVACVTTPISGRKAFIMTSESEEDSLGAQAYQQVLSQSRGHISNDPNLNAVVDRVGKRIAVATGKDYQWQFTLVDSKEQNAFCLPGGKVVVYTGILPVARDEAGLATVLGHEVAHAVARHGGQRITRQFEEQVGLTALSGILGGDDSTQKQLLMAALGVGAKVGYELPFDRQMESEADRIGLTYMAEAGYDPREAPRFWRRFMNEEKGGGTPIFLSDHPSDQSRLQALEALLPEAVALYDRSPKHGLGIMLAR